MESVNAALSMYSRIGLQEIQLSLAGRAQHHVRGRNATPVSTLGLIPYKLPREISYLYKKLSCRREAAQRSMSMKVLLSYTQSHAKLYRCISFY